MKNRPYFIPSKYRQPDDYEKIFCDWAAVYRINGNEYHVQFDTDTFSREYPKRLKILKRTPTCRVVISPDIKSIKKAMEVFEKIIEREVASWANK